MSLVPRTRWQTLLNLDAIRARNKPREAPKAPEKAPFFLPSLNGHPSASAAVDQVTGKPADNDTPDALTLAAERDRILRVDPSALTGESKFTTLLRDTEHPERFVDHLKTLSPSSADMEIRSLREGDEMVNFVEALTRRLKTRRDWELGMAWMSVFLKVHGGVVMEEGEGESKEVGVWGAEDGEGNWREELRQALERWRQVQAGEQKRLSDRVGFCLGVAEFLRSGR